MKTCRCGHRIAVDSFWNGLRHVPYFIDNEEESHSFGQNVSHCPSCGDLLTLDALLSTTLEDFYDGHSDYEPR